MYKPRVPAVAPAGFVWLVTLIVIESAAAAAINDCVTVTEAVSPADIAAEVADTVKVSELATIEPADEGATERTPRPNAATATSAMRLKVVFVDILFLSVVVMKTFSMAALR